MVELLNQGHSCNDTMAGTKPAAVVMLAVVAGCGGNGSGTSSRDSCSADSNSGDTSV